MDYYFPSCRFTALFPEVSARAKTYAKARGMTVNGCCRTDNGRPGANDRAYYVCTNCGLILKEVSQAPSLSLLEYISNDPAFPLPSLKGKTFVIQHCAKAPDRLKELVCSLISKAGGTYTVSRETGYCGTNFMKHMTQRNLSIAPRTFTRLEKQVVVLNEAEQEEKLADMIRQYPSGQVITYCNSCWEALHDRGVEVIHLMELLFPDYIDGVMEFDE